MKVIRKKMRKEGRKRKMKRKKKKKMVRKRRKMNQVCWERDGGCVEDEEQAVHH